MTARAHAFRHEALLYAGPADFVARTAPFIRAAVDVARPVLVMVPGDRIDRLRAALGDDARGVDFADMAVVGRNPGRIIAAWRSFVAKHDKATHLAGIGEPVWAGRNAVELVECQSHENLLNAAFAKASGFTLLCPYDTTMLDEPVVDEALRSHPVIHRGGRRYGSPTFEPASATFGPALDEPSTAALAITFVGGDLDVVRRVVARAAVDAGLGPRRVSELVLAADEVAANSLCYGGGRGRLRVWTSDMGLTCEIADSGVLESPLVGRTPPTSDAASRRGLWLVHQLCDLVQIRSTGDGTTVRMHVSVG